MRDRKGEAFLSFFLFLEEFLGCVRGQSAYFNNTTKNTTLSIVQESNLSQVLLTQLVGCTHSQRMFGFGASSTAATATTASTRILCATFYSPSSSHLLPTTWVFFSTPFSLQLFFFFYFISFLFYPLFLTLFLFNGIGFQMGMFRFLHLHSASGAFPSKPWLRLIQYLCQKLLPLLLVLLIQNLFFIYILIYFIEGIILLFYPKIKFKKKNSFF